MTPPPGSALEWEGQTVLDRAGERIGTIEEIFLVEETGRPEWAMVRIGRLKAHTTLVPLATAHPVEKGVEVNLEKDVVIEAPEVKPDGEPSERQVDALYRHYGIDAGAQTANREPTNGNGGSGSPDLRDEPISELVKQVSDQGSSLAQQEMKLAKAEMSGKAKDLGIGAGIFGGAGYIAHLAGLALMLCIIFALAEAMPAWLAALIVAGVFGAVAGVLALTARKRIRQAGPPIPEQTVASVKQTIATVKEDAKWGLGQRK